MNNINVCLSFDENYYKYAGVVIASILANANDDDNLKFFLLNTGVKKEHKEQILSLKSIKDCEINFIETNEDDFIEYKKVCTHKYITIATYYRLKLASLLSNIDKIVYFDCDIIVNSSLKNLFNTNIDNYFVAGVQDLNKKIIKENPNYVNAGMLIFNLDLIRKENIEERFLKYTKENFNAIKCGDQTIINEVCKNKIKLLDDVWNVQSSNFTNRSSYTNNPKIIHYVAKNKPWKKNCFSYHKNLYFKYLQMTPWKINEKELNKYLKPTTLKYIKYRPLFLFRPRFYKAIYETYIKNKIKPFLIWAKIILKQIFSVNIFDNHLVIYIFSIVIKKKLKTIKKEINLNEFRLDNNRKEKIILTLTSFPDRIEKIEKTIKTLLTQTLKPSRVVLYLANSQFKNKEKDLPKTLLKLKEYGLEIRWCDNLRSYKKLIPALKDFPNDIIITFDDDIYYDNDIVEKLYNLHLKHPDCIITNRSLRLNLVNKKSKIKPYPTAYAYWGKYEKPSLFNSIIGCGGVLYPPNSFNKEVFNVEQFQNLIPTQDDVWFWAMAVLNNTKILTGQGFKLSIINVEDTQHCGLCKINKKSAGGISDRDAFNLLAANYPKIIENMKKEIL